MANWTGSFSVAPVVTVEVAGSKTTFSGFASSYDFDSQFIGATNPLVLSVDTPGTLVFTPDTAGTL